MAARRSAFPTAALTREDPTASALILTGSPLAGHFALPERVDHVRLPGIVQLSDGSCVFEALGLGIDEIVELRAGLIRSAVVSFDPDLLFVDGEPAGFRGELLPALEVLGALRRARIVPGGCDVQRRPGGTRVIRSCAQHAAGRRPLPSRCR